MSYLVLARKYRPQTFADLVGQEQVSRTLQNALATGRIAHAYLFSGPRGVGKTTAARLLAMSLSCRAENVADRPCGRCESCLEIQSGQAVDVIEVDGASNRGINEIRDLRETVKYLPAKGRYKVYIIDEVHALTKDAFNALLKTLEEPPPHVVFIFATTETHKVLPTILSRCQRYDFRRIRVEDISSRLEQVAQMENIEAETEALEIIARQAEGGLRDSLSLMDQAIAAGGGTLTAEVVRRSLGLIDQALVRLIVRETLNGNPAGALSALDEAYLRGYDFKDLGNKILEYARSLTLIKVDRGNARLLNITEAEEAEFDGLAQAHSLETLHRHFDAWLSFQRELNYSGQPRWLLESQVIRLANLTPLMPMAELTERLTRLLAQNPPPPRAAGYHQTPATLPARAEKSTAAHQSARPQVESSPGSTSPRPPAEKEGPDQDEAETEPETENPLASEVQISSWARFLNTATEDILPAWVQALLTGSKALAFGPQRVEVVLTPGEPLAAFMQRQLADYLQSGLKKIFGAAPEISIDRPEDPRLDEKFLAARLEEVKKTDEVKALMEALPGRFIEFRPGPAEPEESEEENAESDENAQPQVGDENQPEGEIELESE